MVTLMGRVFDPFPVLIYYYSVDWRSDSPTALRTVWEITVTSLLWVANWLIDGANRDFVRSNCP